MRFLVAAALLVPASFAQQSVIETRIFDAEVLEVQNPFFPTFNTGPLSTSEAHGTPVQVDIQLEVQFDFRLLITNENAFETNYEYLSPIALTPSICDCPWYDSPGGLKGATGPVPGGVTALLEVLETREFSWSGTSAPFGTLGAWNWTDAWIWHSNIDGYPVLTPHVSASALEILQARATVTGHVTVEWIPNELPHWSVCTGNNDLPTTLTPAGDWDRLWLTQTGVPLDQFNLLIRNTTASNVIPPNGLCITQGGGAFSRIDGSLSLGGVPYLLGFDPSLSGTVHYFQSWFRTDSGPRTGECIGVSVP